MTLTDYIASIEDFYKTDAKDQMDYLAFYIIYHKGAGSFTAKDILTVCGELNLQPYNRLAPYISEESKVRTGKYIKLAKGYQLHAPFRSELERKIAKAPVLVALDQELEHQIASVADVYERDLLEEAARCYKVEAYRAAVVMIWAVTMSHIYNYVFAKELPVFNGAISRDSDKKLKSIKKVEDFGDIKETKFIELLRSAGIITNDTRKILDEKLGIRNTAAHPSKTHLKGSKATEFGQDLIANIILAY